MSHELFVIDQKPELDGEESNRVAYLRDKLSRVEKLGLGKQIVSIKKDIATVERGGLIETAPMTDSELAIWRAWLPTPYTEWGENRGRYLCDYDFDRIPSPVLEVWQKHKESGLFECFEIWTPEIDQPDPILVGMNGHARHLLARWGESDANLVTFGDIKRELERRWFAGEKIGNEPHRNMGIDVFTAFMVSVVAFIVTSAIIVRFHESTTYVDISIVGVLIAVIGICISKYHRQYKTNKLLRLSPLMQAIAKDDSVKRKMY